MPHDIIMPALGMAQDTGLIVAWRKSAGDAVSSGDVLFEVETDKSVMEVESAHDGYLAETRAEAGENVPVGNVIAIITDDKPDAPVQNSSASAQEQSASTTEDQPAAEEAAEPEPAPPPKSSSKPSPKPASKPKATNTKPAAANGRILASPKARRLATERGLDLALLVADGQKQPYHAADLDRLAELGERQPAAGGAASFDYVEARAPGDGYDAFRIWLGEVKDGIDELAVLAAFAASSMRAVASHDGEPLIVEAHKVRGRRNLRFADPDLTGLSGIEETQADAAPSFILRDLTGLTVTSARFGASSVPTMTVSDQDDGYGIALEIPAGLLEPEAAIAIVDEMSARLKEPLRQLL